MKKFLNIFSIVALVILAVAFFTKPSYSDSLLRISHELDAHGYQAGFYFTHRGINNPVAVHSTIEIKDRIFYREIYCPINGKTKKIAIAAFTRLFLIN